MSDHTPPQTCAAGEYIQSIPDPKPGESPIFPTPRAERETTMQHTPTPANKDFTLRAVNAHDDLVEACRTFIALWPTDRDGQIKATPDVKHAYNKARAALAKATE